MPRIKPDKDVTVIIIRCKGYEEVCREFRRFAQYYSNYAVALAKLMDKAGVREKKVFLP